MELEVVRQVSAADRDALVTEGSRLLAFLRPGGASDAVGFVDRIP
jgi:hypothetical protein